jgi:hypothetical protein
VFRRIRFVVAKSEAFSGAKRKIDRDLVFHALQIFNQSHKHIDCFISNSRNYSYCTSNVTVTILMNHKMTRISAARSLRLLAVKLSSRPLSTTPLTRSITSYSIRLSILPIQTRLISSSRPLQEPLEASSTTSDSPDLPGQIDAAKLGSQSSVGAGEQLKGINYFKNKEDPVAKADSEYPEWLWTCLDSTGKAGSSKDSAQSDLFCRFSHNHNSQGILTTSTCS